MKYIVIEIQKSATGEIANIVTSHNTILEAESKYHTILAAAAISNLPVHGAIIVNENCYPVKHDSYTNAGGDSE